MAGPGVEWPTAMRIPDRRSTAGTLYAERELFIDYGREAGIPTDR
jgi:hypothetical protein